MVKLSDGIVDRFHIVSLIPNESAFLYREITVGFLQDFQSDSGISHIRSGGHFSHRQPGNAVYQDMVFVSPVEFVIAFIVLVGSSMDTQRTISIGLGMVFRVKLVFDKGLGVVLFGICQDRRGIQSNKGCIQNTHGIEPLYLGLHNFLNDAVIQVPLKTVISPIGRQFLGNIEAAVVSDKTVILQIIGQIGNIPKALALHDNEGAEHGRRRIAGTAHFLLLLLQFGQVKVEEQGIIECSLWLRSKQANVLYHFLSVDGDQPLWLVFAQLNYTKSADRFLYFLVTKQVVKSQKALQHNDFPYFVQGYIA